MNMKVSVPPIQIFRSSREGSINYSFIQHQWMLGHLHLLYNYNRSKTHKHVHVRLFRDFNILIRSFPAWNYFKSFTCQKFSFNSSCVEPENYVFSPKCPKHCSDAATYLISNSNTSPSLAVQIQFIHVIAMLASSFHAIMLHTTKRFSQTRVYTSVPSLVLPISGFAYESSFSKAINNEVNKTGLATQAIDGTDKPQCGKVLKTRRWSPTG